MEEIRGAVEKGDAVRLEAATHALKGSLGCLCAGPSLAAALRLEETGKGGNLSDVAIALTSLEEEIKRLVETLSGKQLPLRG
jgi:hypothetical protein